MKQEQLLESINENTSLRGIQTYIREVIDIRGFGNQPLEGIMLLCQ